MGHDVIPIAQHNLPTGSIKELAIALAERFNCTVKYGCRNSDYSSDEYIIWLGKVESLSSKVFILIDFNEESFYLNEDNKQHLLQEVSLEFYEEHKYEEANICIMKDAFACAESYAHRWWLLNRAFNGDLDILKSVKEFRLAIKAEVHKMGGSYALYIDDQGPSHYVYEMPGTAPLIGILKKLQVDFGDGLLDISEFLKSPPSEEIEPVKNYMAFYDDFKDLV